MRIGVLARQAGVTASRIRFYEARGLLPLPDRRASGYRDYDDRTLTIVKFITRARALGFSLAEISNHLASPHDGERKLRLLSLVEKKREELDLRLADIERQKGLLAEIIVEIHEYIEKGRSGPE